MSLETRKVLDMVAEGKLTSADAEKLLNKLESAGSSTSTETAPAPSAQAARSLRIVVDEPGKKQVNIRMPLSFLRSGSALIGMMPRQVTEMLQVRGIDLSVLSGKNGDELNKLLQELQVNIDKGDGKKVRIFCE
jgi:hypothetical protein